MASVVSVQAQDDEDEPVPMGPPVIVVEDEEPLPVDDEPGLLDWFNQIGALLIAWGVVVMGIFEGIKRLIRDFAKHIPGLDDGKEFGKYVAIFGTLLASFIAVLQNDYNVFDYAYNQALRDFGSGNFGLVVTALLLYVTTVVTYDMTHFFGPLIRDFFSWFKRA
jgi:hypothetical protein